MTVAAFDYVIVGGGTAGCVLANRLSADRRTRVLMLEAGPRDNYLWIHIPIGYGKTMFHPVYNWGFHTEPEPEMKGRRIYWPRGRGPRRLIVDQRPHLYPRHSRRTTTRGRRRATAAGAGATSCRTSSAAKAISAAPVPCMAATGPLACSDIGAAARAHRGDHRGRSASSACRAPMISTAAYRKARAITSSSRNTACAAARRWAICGPRKRRAQPGGRKSVRRLTRVLFDGARAVGVEYRQGGESRARPRAREVILAAGSLQSPQLLQLSGIGPAAAAAEVRHSSSSTTCPALVRICRTICNCGSSSSARNRSRPTTISRRLGAPRRSACNGCLRRAGPLAVGINQGGLFTRALPESSAPDIQFHFATLSADLAGAKPHPFSGFTMSVCQLRPTSRGHVRIKSADPPRRRRCSPTTSSTEPRPALRGGGHQVRAPARGRPRRCGPMSSPSIGPARRRPATPTCSISRANSAPRSSIPRATCDDGIGPAGRRRRPIARPRRRRPASGRLLDHAHAGLGQHQRSRS